MSLQALFLTLFSGLFFLLGFIVVRFVKAKKELSILATGLALIIMLGMLFFDLIPEIIELTVTLNGSKAHKILLTLLFIGLGVVTLKIFDLFLPHHHHHHKDENDNLKEHNSHLFHVGFILAISLVLHNILEGMSLYIIATESVGAGVLMMLGVGLHNLPLGVEVASNMELSKQGRKMQWGMMALLSLSSFVGGLILFFLGSSLSDFMMFFLVCVACGMILYIALFELLREIFSYKNNRFTYFGISLGFILLFLMTFFE